MNLPSTGIDRTRRAVAKLLPAWTMLLALGFMSPAMATDIENTARVTYQDAGTGTATTLRSNTVVTSVLPIPTPATLAFLRYDPAAPDRAPLALDGGQCRIAGGEFVPLPEAMGSDGLPLDPGGADGGSAPGYYAGEPVILSIDDANRNADPNVREFVDVDITTTTGDAETVRLRETAADSGRFAGAVQSVPMPPAATRFDCVLSLEASSKLTARYVDADFPLDALEVAAAGYARLEQPMVLRLEMAASRELVERGDFFQYTLVLRNPHEAPALRASIVHELPQGLRYRRGSLRIAATPVPGGIVPASRTGPGARASGPGVPASDPEIGPDGRTLSIPMGDIQPDASVTATFVVEVGSGAAGPDLLANAVAHASGGIRSNNADALVRMREALLSDRFTIVGRVLEGGCGDPEHQARGAAGVRVLLQDGSYAITDQNGAYHFEGVRPGTHVVQLDPSTLPAGLEVAHCPGNTRFAGRGHSQFVEAQGGSLWRADFRLQASTPASGEVGLQLAASAIDGGWRVEAVLDGTTVPVTGLRAMVPVPVGASYRAGSVTVDGVPVADPVISEGIAIFDLGDPGAGWRRALRFQFAAPDPCAAGAGSFVVLGLFNAGAGQVKLPPGKVDVACGGSSGAAARAPRVVVETRAAAGTTPASPFAEQQLARAAIQGDAAAAGGEADWMAVATGQPAEQWLFPAIDYNPRAPVTRVVIRHLPDQKALLRVNGAPAQVVHYEGIRLDPKGNFGVSLWRGIGLREGDNLLEADLVDGSGKVAATISRTVHFSGMPMRAELVPGQSILVADGVNKPVIAVRLLDRSGRPVRNGLTGELQLSAPHLLATTVEEQQSRQLAGIDGSKAVWQVEGDDGIAYIELQPTGNAGQVTLGFKLGDPRHATVQELHAWLKSVARDWIVVGFAKGSVGYETLADNMQPLPEDEDGTGVRGDGQVSLYAKGRVLGSWLLTLAYDSDKPTDELRGRSLLSTIDPQQYYTLYGDGAYQGYDAASASKLYLKLERDQFQALFGDFQTGLDRTELSRYQRTLNGIKVEYRGALVEFNGFVAETTQNFARDELPGDGTSGLYRLTRPNIVINSERVRLQTRDRYHSERILEERDLARHIDYDIDYANGTLFFREPIASRDFDFNPNFIVVEYETVGTADEHLNGGGRIGVHLAQGRMDAGLSYIRDEDMAGRSTLVGVDARFRPTSSDEIRGEMASSSSDGAHATGTVSGNAWLLEWEHRGEAVNLLAYARRQGLGFGLGQQNRTEQGTFKTGIQGQWRLGPEFSLQGEAYRVENLANGSVRDAARAEVVYRQDQWNARAGLQWARDEAADGKVAESRQMTLGASRFLLDKKLELSAQADLSLGGRNESVDFPTRLQLGAAYRISDAFRLLAAQEFTDGKDRDTATTRLGFETTPWSNARLTSTLNQSRITEYGPRTFALFGLNQRFLAGERWGFDVSIDSSRAFNESGDTPLVVDPSQPIATGGLRDGGALTEDFTALSGGATYRTPLWSWNMRAETRQGDSNDRHGFTSAFLRQARDGVAMSASVHAFSQHNADGSTGLLGNAQISWAYRPPGSRWSMLDKLEFRLDEIRHGRGEPIIGNDTVAAVGDARSRRLVNNFVVNYASDAWAREDSRGVLSLDQRSQLSLYYGSRYVLDSFGDDDYSGYTDIIGAEWRLDLSSRLDIGLRASVLHSWSQDTYAWALGPSIGFTPFTNAWVSLGYNVRGFQDRDFENAHHTAQGPYLVFRMKFDQQSLGLDRNSAGPDQ